MNATAEQKSTVYAEQALLMNVGNNILNVQTPSTNINIVQNALVGAYLLTTRDSFFKKEEVMQMLAFVESWNRVLPIPAIWKRGEEGQKPIRLWTGKQVMSCILPKMNFTRVSKMHPEEENTHPRNRNMSPTDSVVIIQKGELVCGYMCKNTLGSSPGNLIHMIVHDSEFVGDKALQFVNDIQLITSIFLQTRGFSMGLSDIMPSDDVVSQKIAILKAAKEEIHKLRDNMNTDEKQRNTIMKTILDNLYLNTTSMSFSSLDKNNSMLSMYKAGSKGDLSSPAKMSRMVGVQTVNGHAIKPVYGTRILPHFHEYDTDLSSHSFVSSNYVEGLTFAETIIHAISGREGPIDTAVKTSETGYIQRKLSKATEDIVVEYDGTVRNSMGMIVQFAYGDDAMDASTVLSQKLPMWRMSDVTFNSTYVWEGASSHESELIKAEFHRLLKDRKLTQTSQTESVTMPVSIYRIVDGVMSLRVSKPQPGEVISATSAIQVLLNLQRKLWRMLPSGCETWNLFFSINLRSHLASKRVVSEYKLTEYEMAMICTKIEVRFAKSMATPGDMIGIMAGHSLGEPATQMTLNTSHFSGDITKNVTLGVPRLKELINATSKIKTPMITVRLVKSREGNKQIANIVKNYIQCVKLETLLENVSIVYEPHKLDKPPQPQIDPLDYLAELFRVVPDIDAPEGVDDEGYSDWILKLNFDSAKIREHDVTLVDIVSKIKKTHGHLFR